MHKNLKQLISYPVILGMILFLITFIYQRSLPQTYNLKPGSISPYDIVATGDVADRKATEARAKESAAQVKLVMGRSEEISEYCLERLAGVFEQVEQERLSLTKQSRIGDNQSQTNQAGEAALVNPLPTATAEQVGAAVPGLRDSLKSNLEVDLSEDVLKTLLGVEKSIFDSIKTRALAAADAIMAAKNDQVDLHSQIERKTGEIVNSVEYYQADYKSIQEILTATLQPNLVYDEAATKQAQEAEYKRVQENPIMIPQGSRIVTAGETVTPEIYDQLKELNLIDSGRIDTRYMTGIAILVVAVVLAGGLYFRHFERERVNRYQDRLVTLLICLLPVLAAGWLTRSYSTLSLIYLATVILTMYFDLRTGLFISLLLAALTAPLSTTGYQFLFITVLTIIGIGVLTEVYVPRNRYAILITGSALVGGLVAFIYDLLSSSGLATAGTNAGLSALSAGLSTVLAIGINPLVELFFSSVSPLKLIELSQSSNPLLRKLFLEAPGTYQHSMMVANLAETAADAIGANGLLVRVGAYYHDIGKTANPLMFTENQTGENPHNRMTPEQSAQVIIAHVETGVKMARENRLPLPVQHIMMEHHGNTRASFFYDKALQEAQEKGLPEPDVNRFRYPWPIPSSRESAIVMLADSCEAAMKSNEIRDIERTEELIRRIVKGKIDLDQMASSGLSFSDVELIIQAFLRVYAGQFHKRVRYPDDDQDDKQAG